MKKNKFYLLTGFLGLIITTLAVSSLASAQEGFRGRFFDKPDESKHQAAEQAIEAQDYQAWVTAMGQDNPMTQNITADNFAEFVKMHQAMKDGDFETAQSIAQELGLPKFGMGMRHMGDKDDFEAGYQKGLSDCQASK